MTPEIQEILEKYARSAIGEVTDATMSAARGAHPLLEQLASLLLGEVINEKTITRLVVLLERLVVELVGDDYPTKIEAAKIVIEDNRED